MKTNVASVIEAYKTPVRQIGALAYYDVTGADIAIWDNENNLKSYTIDRVCEESKFYGFVSQGKCKTNRHQ